MSRRVAHSSLAIAVVAAVAVWSYLRLSAAQQAKDEAADSAFNLNGQVLTPDGQPAPHAVIRAFNVFTKQEVGNPTNTGADGRFELRLDKSPFEEAASQHEAWRLASITAEADGFAPSWAFAYQLLDETMPKLRLAQNDMTVQGRIVNEKGRPVAGAEITPMRVWRPADGHLDDFLADYRTHPSKLLGLLSKLTVEGFPEVLKLQAEKHHNSFVTDNEGNFEIQGLGREWVVQFRVACPGYAGSFIRVVTRPEIESALLKDLDAGTRERTREKLRLSHVYAARFTHVLEPGYSIQGALRDRETRKPLSNVKLDVRISGQDYYCEVRSDDDGTYRIEGLRKGAEVRIHVQPTADQPYSQVKRSVNVTADRSDVDFDLARGVFVQGKVTLADTGEPIRCIVGYIAADNNPHLQDLGDPLGSYFNIVTDSQGRYALCALPGPGKLLVNAHAARGSDLRFTSAPKSVDLDPEQEIDVDLTVKLAR